MLKLGGSDVSELWSRGEADTSDKGVVASGTVLQIKVGAGRGKKEEKIMSSISGVSSFVPVQRDVAVGSRSAAGSDVAVAEAGQAVTDRVELSGTSRPDVSGYVAKLKNNDVRTDKVADIRSQLDAGTYEDDHKLNVAVDRLWADLQS